MKAKSLFIAAICVLCGLLPRGLSAQVPEPANYLRPVVAELEKSWPTNRRVNIVCHGHSVPAGYFRTPVVDTFHAYPHLLHVALKERFPRAVVNVIVTAIGGEDSVAGAKRFDQDVLSLRPDVVTIDYALNDRVLGLAKAREAWISMIEKAKASAVKVILLTPSPDLRAKLDEPGDPLNKHAEQVRALAAEFQVSLVDSLALFKAERERGRRMEQLMSQLNHPNAQGHALIAKELSRLWEPGSQGGSVIATPMTAMAEPLPPEQPLPETGRLYHDFTDEPNSYLVVEPARTNAHLYVKVEHPATGKLVASMFIRAGEATQMVLPNDTYVIKVASGTNWFGTNKMFGPHGFYGILRPGIRLKPYEHHIIGLKDEVLAPMRQENVRWNQF